MIANTTSVKDWTNILVSWLSLIGIVTAGGWTVLEYLGRQEQREVAVVLERVKRLESGPVAQAYFEVENAWINGASDLNEKLKMVDTNKEASRVYRRYILDFIEERGIAFEVRRIMHYFERLAACVDAGICDRETTYRLLGPQALWIRNNHYPYIVRLRELTKNEQYFAQFNEFTRQYHAWKKDAEL